MTLLGYVAAAEILDGREATDAAWDEIRAELQATLLAWMQEESPEAALLGGLDLVRDMLLALVHVRGAAANSGAGAGVGHRAGRWRTSHGHSGWLSSAFGSVAVLWRCPDPLVVDYFR